MDYLLRDTAKKETSKPPKAASSHHNKICADIIALEDLFYCAHNAVRSAQTGEAGTVPSGFHPVNNGGVVHERRHGLTWLISAGVAWDDTDLST